jgi:hypothetical protein
VTTDHQRSLAATARIPDLTEGAHTVRVRYDPNLDPALVTHQVPSLPPFHTSSWSSLHS